MKLFRRRQSDGPMSCAEVGELLQEYLDDQLDASRAARLEAHLEECRRCGLEADTYRQIKRSLASRQGDLPPDALGRLRDFGRRLADGELSPPP
jgi:anti-sigma factor (TIGR02949 family)